MNYDQWKTTPPHDYDDDELCEHGKPYPCSYCKFDALEMRADILREERAEDLIRWIDGETTKRKDHK